MKVKKSANRWRKWSCHFGENRYEEAQKDIAELSNLGFKAKIWAPLHQHKTTGHVHVSVLILRNQDRYRNLLTIPSVLLTITQDQVEPSITIDGQRWRLVPPRFIDLPENSVPLQTNPRKDTKTHINHVKKGYLEEAEE